MEKCGFSDTGMLNRCSQLVGGDTDEDKETLALSGTPVDTEQQRVAAQDSAMNTRPELRMLHVHWVFMVLHKSREVWGNSRKEHPV